MSSPPPSPLIGRTFSQSTGPLRVSNVANLLVKIGRARSNKHKAHHIDSSSGAPQTHPSLTGDGVLSEVKVPVIWGDQFICRDGVDVVRLLRAVRNSVYEKAQTIGATVLVDEEWFCTICAPRNRKDETFRVTIRYAAQAARSDRRDPRQPPNLDQAHSVPGLMTIVSRRE